MTRRIAPFLGAAAALLVCVFALAGERVLYEKDSDYNTIVVTEDDRGLRTLRFEKGGARQSVVKVGDPDHLELPYARAMLAGLAVVDDPKRVLIIGLGGGTIPSFIHRHYPEAAIDAVDIDPEVVDVAKRFFGFREDGRMRAHVGDGRRFIEECRNRYDVIFLDAFGSDNIPYHLATREFLQGVRRALAPNGVVVGDVWGRHSNPLYDSMVRTYQDVFEELYVLDVRGAGNKILIALPRPQRISRDELAGRAEEMSKRNGFRFNLGELVNHGFRDTATEEPRGRVLTDKQHHQQ